MKYHLRKSVAYPESHYLVTREEIDDQLRTGQIDHTWQVRAEGELQWMDVSPSASTAQTTPRRSSAGSFILLALVLTVIFMALCGLSGTGPLSSLLPSISVAREALASRIERESSGLIRLVAFEKTNGIENPIMGHTMYQIEYTATIEAVDNCLWCFGGSIWEGSFDATPGKPRSGMEAFNPQVVGKNPAIKGQRQRISGKIVLQKTDNGWRAAE